MKRSHEAQAVEMIPIERITVINPRVRNKKKFKEIISNIAEIGLKKPITVTRRDETDGARYDLVCGQGRLEAYQVLGQSEIPALVVDADTEDCMLMSLVETLPAASTALSICSTTSKASSDGVTAIPRSLGRLA